MSELVNWPSILQIEAGSTITEKTVQANYRSLAKKCHPDAGGSTESMTQLNLAKQAAMQWIEKERARREEHQKRDDAYLQQINRYMQQAAASSQGGMAQAAYASCSQGISGLAGAATASFDFSRMGPIIERKANPSKLERIRAMFRR